MPKVEQASLSQHYQKSADEYEQAWFYLDDSPYQDFLLKEHLTSLDLQPRDELIADIGAGSCNFSAKLGKAATLPVACVEPAESLLQPDVAKEGCVKVLASAEDYFKEKPKGVTKIIVKETVHHIEFDKGNTATVFNEMAATLRQNGGGKLVVMTRPHDCSHFPFCARVAAEWKKGQPESDLYVNALLASGFDHVDTRVCEFEVTMKLQKWFGMVRSRFWSCFRNVSDADLEAGLAELEKKQKGAEEIVMADKLVFIVATVDPSTRGYPAEEAAAAPVADDDGGEPYPDITYGADVPERLTTEKMEKKMKKVTKEGGKRGVEIEGAADMGGLGFFCTTMDEPQGDVDLLYESMRAMNFKSDPTEEERKGGSGRIGKMIISTDQANSKLALVAYCPPSKHAELKAEDWMKELLVKLGGGEVVFGDAYTAKAVVPNDPEKNLFVLKLKDSAISESINFLKGKGLFPDKIDDSDDEFIFGDDDFPSM